MFIELTSFGGDKILINIWRIDFLRPTRDEERDYKQKYSDMHTYLVSGGVILFIKEEYKKVKNMIYKAKKEIIEKISRAQLLDFD